MGQLFTRQAIITIELENEVLIAGEEMVGKVLIEVIVDKVKCENIVLRLLGWEYIFVKGFVVDDDIDEVCKFLDLSYSLANLGLNGELSRGFHEYSFRMPLPIGLKPNMIIKNDQVAREQRGSCSITYKLQVRVQRPGLLQFDVVYAKDILISRAGQTTLQSFPLYMLPPVVPIKNFGGLNTSGGVSIAGNLSASVLFPGDQVFISFYIHKFSSSTINSMTVTLNQVISWTPTINRFTRKLVHPLSSHTVPPIYYQHADVTTQFTSLTRMEEYLAQESVTNRIKESLEKKEYKIRSRIPRHQPGDILYPTFRNRLIAVTHEVLLTVHLSCGTAITTTLPFVLLFPPHPSSSSTTSLSSASANVITPTTATTAMSMHATHGGTIAFPPSPPLILATVTTVDTLQVSAVGTPVTADTATATATVYDSHTSPQYAHEDTMTVEEGIDAYLTTEEEGTLALPMHNNRTPSTTHIHPPITFPSVGYHAPSYTRGITIPTIYKPTLLPPLLSATSTDMHVFLTQIEHAYSITKELQHWLSYPHNTIEYLNPVACANYFRKCLHHVSCHHSIAERWKLVEIWTLARPTYTTAHVRSMMEVLYTPTTTTTGTGDGAVGVPPVAVVEEHDILLLLRLIELVLGKITDRENIRSMIVAYVSSSSFYRLFVTEWIMMLPPLLPQPPPLHASTSTTTTTTTRRQQGRVNAIPVAPHVRPYTEDEEVVDDEGEDVYAKEDALAMFAVLVKQ